MRKKAQVSKLLDQGAASGSGTEMDVDEGNVVVFSKEETSGRERVERMISFQRPEEVEKENLLQKCLTPRDVGKLNSLFIATKDPMLGRTMRVLSFEDVDGKSWKIRCSYIKQSYVFTKGWRGYVKEKQLGVGDFVFFQRHRTDSNRLFIGCRRRGDGDASLQGRDNVLPDPTSPAASSVHQGRSSALGQRDYVLPDPTSPAASSVQSRSSALGQRDNVNLDLTSLDTQFTNYEFSPVDWNHVFPDSTYSVTSSEALELREKLKEVETPLQLPEHSITGFDPILVISCGDSQESEETFFISYIINELCLHGFTTLRYDLTRSTVPGNQEMLYSSCVGIMIISMNYACSRECLDGFVAIMDHLKGNKLVLIPVFFKVSLSDVRNQSGSFGRAFLQLGNSLQASQVQKWRTDMRKLTSIKGYQYTKGHEVILSKNVVRDVCLVLSSKTNEIKLALESILPLLDGSQSSAPHSVGLWGMAGIGKTILAREIFVTQAERYDICYFLPDFHLLCQTKGLGHLRDEFFSKIFGEEENFIDAYDTKLSFLRDKLMKKRVLIVLDGVSNARDVEVLVGGFGWFSGGHTIILTSRNRQVLVQCKVKELYRIPILSMYESLSVFGQSQTENSQKGIRSLILELVKYSSGIPLALRVLSSSIENKCISDEKKHMRRLRQNPPVEIQDAFRRSFDVLDDNEKNTFLDLACFFRGEDKDHVVNILDGCGYLTDLGIYGLIDESLIILVDNRIKMPNIFQDTGRFVVCQENVEAGKRSRLWDSDDIADVLTSNTGTEAIEGIFFDVSGLTVELSSTVFERMYRLRLLKLYHRKVCLPQGLHSLPDELRLLHWEIFPLESLPRNFNPKNLVELNMPYSNMTKLWKGKKDLKKLKRIILSHSRQLTEFPRLSKARNLEHIDLEGCTSLVKVNSSILRHQKLTFLSLKDCLHLQIMPTTVHLESLEVLNLSGCSELEDLQDLSPNLKELYLAGTAIREMPWSLGYLTRLGTLDLENCKRLQHLPPGIRTTVTLNLSGCINLRSHPTLHHLPPGIHNQKAVVSHSVKRPAKRPASSMDLSTMEDMSPPYRRYQLKRVIEEVILSLRKRKREKSVSTATNLSEVQHGPGSTAVKDLAYTSVWRLHALPERPGQPECHYYMKTGNCRDGNVCKFHHPKDRETHVFERASSMASVTQNLNRPKFSLRELVESLTKKPRIQKNTSSMVSEISHVNPQRPLPTLGASSSFVSGITQENDTYESHRPPILYTYKRKSKVHNA